MSAASRVPEPPDGLGAAGLDLWEAVLAGGDGYEVDLRGDELAVLAHACRTADVIADLDRQLAESELMIEGSRSQLVLNPAVGEVRQQRQLLASLLRQLDIPEPDDTDWDRLTSSQRARKAAGARWGR